MSEKKSEKLELRVTYEDKERLQQLAEAEGHSVSELVRSVVRRYLDLNTSTRVIRRGWVPAVGAVALALAGGVMLGSLWPDSVAEADDAASPEALSYRVSTALLIKFGPLDERMLRQEFVVTADGQSDGEDSFVREVNARDRLYRMAYDYSDLGNRSPGGDFILDVCRVEGEDCESIANLRAHLGEGYGASMDAIATGGEHISLEIERAYPPL